MKDIESASNGEADHLQVQSLSLLLTLAPSATLLVPFPSQVLSSLQKAPFKLVKTLASSTLMMRVIARPLATTAVRY